MLKHVSSIYYSKDVVALIRNVETLALSPSVFPISYFISRIVRLLLAAFRNISF